MSSAPVTIVGAGPSGLTLAWWLIQHGHTVTVLERESTVPKDMRASTFHPATLDLLADSGLADALVAMVSRLVTRVENMATMSNLEALEVDLNGTTSNTLRKSLLLCLTGACTFFTFPCLVMSILNTCTCTTM